MGQISRPSVNHFNLTKSLVVIIVQPKENSHWTTEVSLQVCVYVHIKYGVFVNSERIYSLFTSFQKIAKQPSLIVSLCYFSKLIFFFPCTLSFLDCLGSTQFLFKSLEGSNVSGSYLRSLRLLSFFGEKKTPNQTNKIRISKRNWFQCHCVKSW